MNLNKGHQATKVPSHHDEKQLGDVVTWQHGDMTIKRVKDITFEHITEMDQLFDSAMKFYAGVKERDGVMEQMIEQRLKETGADKVVVITGGFHSGPFRDYFTSKGYTYAMISPKLTGSDEAGHQAYIANILRSAQRTTRNAQRETQEGSSLTVDRSTLRAQEATLADVSPADPYVYSPAQRAFYGLDPRPLVQYIGGIARRTLKDSKLVTQAREHFRLMTRGTDATDLMPRVVPIPGRAEVRDIKLVAEVSPLATPGVDRVETASQVRSEVRRAVAADEWALVKRSTQFEVGGQIRRGKQVYLIQHISESSEDVSLVPIDNSKKGARIFKRRNLNGNFYRLKLVEMVPEILPATKADPEPGQVLSGAPFSSGTPADLFNDVRRWFRHGERNFYEEIDHGIRSAATVQEPGKSRLATLRALGSKEPEAGPLRVRSRRVGDRGPNGPGGSANRRCALHGTSRRGRFGRSRNVQGSF